VQFAGGTNSAYNRFTHGYKGNWDCLMVDCLVVDSLIVYWFNGG
jgi:hypothetical protein